MVFNLPIAFVCWPLAMRMLSRSHFEEEAAKSLLNEQYIYASLLQLLLGQDKKATPLYAGRSV
jgi:hypothetical protein